MFKKMRRLFSVALVLSMLTATGLQAGAEAYDFSDFLEDYEAVTIEEQRRIEMITNSPNSEEWLGVFEENMHFGDGISPHQICPYCEKSFTVTVCAGDATLVDEGYHRGFLGLFETDCYAYYFMSRGARMCPNCTRVVEEFGQHYCWESHKKCSRGEFDVCTMDVS